MSKYVLVSLLIVAVVYLTFADGSARPKDGVVKAPKKAVKERVRVIHRPVLAPRKLHFGRSSTNTTRAPSVRARAAKCTPVTSCSRIGGPCCVSCNGFLNQPSFSCSPTGSQCVTSAMQCQCQPGFKTDGNKCIDRRCAGVPHASFDEASGTCVCDPGYKVKMGECMLARPSNP